MCGAPVGGVSLDDVDVAKEAVIVGEVLRDGVAVGGAFVRLLDDSGEFTAEVVTSATGGFRFFAAPGKWTLRALAPGGRGEVSVAADRGVIAEARIDIAA